MEVPYSDEGKTDMTYEYEHVKPADIEATSMKIIGEELAEKGIALSEEEAPIVKRVIHTTADFDYAENLYISEGAVEAAIKAVAGGVRIVTDTNMALSGVSKPALAKVNGEAMCYMADPEVAKAAKENGTTRAVASMERAVTDMAGMLPEGGKLIHLPLVFAVGNAPTALIKLSEMMREGLRPALIIGVPVGFVNVVESKEEIIEVCKAAGVPAIVARGRKGGSNVAASICNAILYMATDHVDPASRKWL